MTELNLFENLKNAFDTSTHNFNAFALLISQTVWDSEFQADEEYYFIKGGMTFITPSLNPFDMPWNPSAIFSDGSMLEF